ncbi:MAG: flagellar basal body-associated FliL family protein [Armatimonadota bacterium]
MRLSGPRDGSGMLKVIVLILAGLLLGGGGFFAWSKLSGGEEGREERAAEEKQADQETAMTTETLSLGEFLVNLRTSGDSLRYLLTEVSIVVAVPAGDEEDDGGHGGHGGQKGAEDEPELPPASHRYARDVAIEVLSSQSFEKLRDQPDRSMLKAALQQKLDAALASHDVQDVLFTAFVMQ